MRDHGKCGGDDEMAEATGGRPAGDDRGTSRGANQTTDGRALRDRGGAEAGIAVIRISRSDDDVGPRASTRIHNTTCRKALIG